MLRRASRRQIHIAKCEIWSVHHRVLVKYVSIHWVDSFGCFWGPTLQRLEFDIENIGYEMGRCEVGYCIEISEIICAPQIHPNTILWRHVWKRGSLCVIQIKISWKLEYEEVHRIYSWYNDQFSRASTYPLKKCSVENDRTGTLICEESKSFRPSETSKNKLD